MAPRAYDNSTRQQQQQELRARIAAAAARLHAAKGALATSYADIAREAGVSLPTVYNHFPDQDGLIAACTGHVAAQAPELPALEILSAPDLPASAQQLAEAMDRIHAHFEPWMAWGEHRLIPALQAMVDRERQQLTGLIAQVLDTYLGPGDHGEAAATWETLLSFGFWHRLLREHKLPRAAVRRTLVHLLLAASGPQPAASAPRPPSRK